MIPNPVLERLNYSNEDRVVVFHADDIGMTHGSVAAYADLLPNSPLSSAAVMVPCPWFPAAAELIRDNAEHPKLDVGVHLTLNSEWSLMRWGPVGNTAVTHSLSDNDGYFYHRPEDTHTHATADAVAAEINAQIERAIAVGIAPTHIDSHMGTLFHTSYLPSYIQAGMKLKVPFLALRMSEEQYLARGYERETAVQLAQSSAQLEAQGHPLFDTIDFMPLHHTHSYSDRLEHAIRILNELPAGLHYFIIHPSTDSPQLRALSPNWEARLNDYKLFLDPKWHSAIDASGVHVIGMKLLAIDD